jgi:hypothetical protein
MLTVRNISTVALLCLLLSCLLNNVAFGQKNIGMEKFSLQVLNDTVLIKSNQFAFNSITINNTSTQNLKLGVRFSLPAGWNFVTIPNPSVEVKRGEFISIPFRIAASKSALGDLSYPITVFIKNPISGKEVSESFYVKIKQNTNWTANLVNSNLFIEEKDSLSKFQLRIKNNGNKRELFEISIKTDLKLSLASEGTQAMIWPGRDTTINVYVASRAKTSNSNSVAFFVKAKNESNMLTGNVYFTSAIIQGNKSKFGTLPVDFEFFAINAFGQSSGYLFFDINGSYNINKKKSISFRARTNSFNADYSINTHYYSLNYKTKRFDLSLGSQNMFFNYQINGYGAKMAFKTDTRKEYEIYGIKSQISNANIIGFRQDNQKKEQRTLSSDILFVQDLDKKELTLFGLHNYEKRHSSSKLFALSGGYSTEKKMETDSFQLGYMGGYRLETKIKFAHIQSTFQYYSSKFSGILKGVQYGSHEIKMGGNGTSFALFSESNSRNPFSEENLVGGIQVNFKTTEHGVRFDASKLSIRSTLAISFLEQYQKNNFLSKMDGYKSSLDFSINKGKFVQSTTVSYMKSKVKEIDDNRLRDSYSAFYQLKYKAFGINANYTLGPNFYYDYISFVSANVEPTTHNVSVFFELKNKKHTFFDRINLTNNSNSVFSKPATVLRNEIYFEFPKANASVNIFANVNVLEPKLAPSLNVSLKKTINVPLIFKQKYYSASVFLFKDANNNDLFDKGEEPIHDATLNVNGQPLKTNKKGMIYLKNMERDDYVLDYRKIQNLKGWVVKEGSVDTLVLDRNISIGVPFKQSRMVAGKVRFEIENSNREVKESLTGIMVVAVNRKGEMFRSTTNERGEFYINLSEDIYNIQIPTNIFGEGFRVDRSILTVDLTKEKYSEIEFKVIQKKRAINIKKD